MVVVWGPVVFGFLGFKKEIRILWRGAICRESKEIEKKMMMMMMMMHMYVSQHFTFLSVHFAEKIEVR